MGFRCAVFFSTKLFWNRLYLYKRWKKNDYSKNHLNNCLGLFNNNNKIFRGWGNDYLNYQTLLGEYNWPGNFKKTDPLLRVSVHLASGKCQKCQENSFFSWVWLSFLLHWYKSGITTAINEVARMQNWCGKKVRSLVWLDPRSRA